MGPIHVLERLPAPPRAGESELRLHVIYSTPETTRASLKAATLLARGLGATVELLVPTVVPYPLPLERPPAAPESTETALNDLARDCGVDVAVRVLLCRDREQTIPCWLPPHSIAVIGRRRAWGPGSSRRLIRAIRRQGHHVIVVGPDGRSGR